RSIDFDPTGDRLDLCGVEGTSHRDLTAGGVGLQCLGVEPGQCQVPGDRRSVQQFPFTGSGDVSTGGVGVHRALDPFQVGVSGDGLHGQIPDVVADLHGPAGGVHRQLTVHVTDRDLPADGLQVQVGALGHGHVVVDRADPQGHEVPAMGIDLHGVAVLVDGVVGFAEKTAT